MLLRRSSHPLFTVASKVFWPAVALGILALALGRRSHANSASAMPRLPVRRKPMPPSSSRLRRLSAPPAEVEPPGSFWDARDGEDDPAEIPDHASPLVSEASRSAAGVAPGAFYDASAPLRW